MLVRLFERTWGQPKEGGWHVDGARVLRFIEVASAATHLLRSDRV